MLVQRRLIYVLSLERLIRISTGYRQQGMNYAQPPLHSGTGATGPSCPAVKDVEDSSQVRAEVQYIHRLHVRVRCGLADCADVMIVDYTCYAQQASVALRSIASSSCPAPPA